MRRFEGVEKTLIYYDEKKIGITCQSIYCCPEIGEKYKDYRKLMPTSEDLDPHHVQNVKRGLQKNQPASFDAAPDAAQFLLEKPGFSSSELPSVLAHADFGTRERITGQLQSRYGNAAVQRMIQRKRRARSRLSNGSEEEQSTPIQRINTYQAREIQRDPIPHPAVKQKVSGLNEPKVKFGQMSVIPGGLAPGKTRTPKIVFRGDTLLFKATTNNISPGDVETGLGGSVLGENTPPQK